MRRIAALACIALVLSACHNGPISYTVQTPQSPESAFACSLRKVNELGYTVTNSNKEAGFIAAEKHTTKTAMKLFTNQELQDQLTISIFESGNGKQTIRATAGTTTQRSTIFSQQTKTDQPSKDGIGAANDLLLACGEGAVTKQANAERYEAQRPARLSREAH
jgi:hypothetical protein